MENQNSYNINFDRAQISFALQPQRLLFIDTPTCWLEFHCVNEGNMMYIDYSPEQLCERFLNRILVQINKFVLNNREKHMINLLQLHPKFTRTEDGFTASAEYEKIDFGRNANKAFEEGGPMRNSPDDFIMNNSDLKYQVVLTPNDGEQRWKHQLSAENAALLSVALSSQDQLPTFERLPEEEILKRLRKAKHMFENRGYQMENVNISIDDLVIKLIKLRELKQAIISLVKENF